MYSGFCVVHNPSTRSIWAFSTAHTPSTRSIPAASTALLAVLAVRHILERLQYDTYFGVCATLLSLSPLIHWWRERHVFVNVENIIAAPAGRHKCY